MMICNTYYDIHRTRKFTDIYESAEDFIAEFNEGPFEVDNVNLELVFYLLYAKYGNSHISYSDENQFKFALFSKVFQYGPTWAKRLEIQKSLRELKADFTEDGIFAGGKAIYNHSFNPSTAPTLEELPTINDQNTTNYKKSKMEGYAHLLSLLETDVTEEFINKFKSLFIVVAAGPAPLLYETTITEVE